MMAITYERYGPPDVLTVENVAAPISADDEILIRVQAAEATKSDCELRSFRFAVKWFWLPLRLWFGPFRPRKRILGGYFSGIVESVGAEARRFAVGDEVFGCAAMRFGGYGEYIALPASYPIATKPANMSFEEAAAVPLGGLNALHFMTRAQVHPGEHVLVNGAGGSIGTHAVQIAKSMGAVVTAVDSGIKEAMLRGIGADHFIDYRKESYTAGTTRYDVILDMVARSPYRKSIAMLKKNGRYLKGNPRFSDIIRAPFTSRLSGKTVVMAFAPETKDALDRLRELIEQGAIRSIVDRVFAMSEAPTAHRLVESEERRGAIVLRIGSPHTSGV